LFSWSPPSLLILPLVLQAAGNAWVRIADMALLYVLLALGLNIVVGYAGLLDLGFVAFFAVGAYMYGLMASPHLTESLPWFAQMFPNGLHMPLWMIIPAGGRAGGIVRHAAGRAHAQAARRLPGHRDAGFR
jgi:branched-chain amino acid transport system permease protein